MNEASLSHTRWDCTYHIVWIPKYRRKVLYQQNRPEVGAPVGALFERKGCEVVEGSVCADHVHACVRMPPKLAVSDVMGCDGVRQGQERHGAARPPPGVGQGRREGVFCQVELSKKSTGN